MAEVSVTDKVIARIRVSDTRLRRALSGAIWGPVWLTWGDCSFPGEHWDDIALDIVIAMSEAILGDPGAIDEVRFPDGPFSVTIGPKNGQRIRLVMRDYVKDEKCADIETDFGKFRQSIRLSGSRILAKCQEEDWKGGRIDYLRDILRRMR
jgi:hypothetical protein